MNKQISNKERGITLIALIITIIILVILAAVSVRAVYNMGIVDYAVNGTQNYAKASVTENKTLDNTVSLIEDTIGKLNDIQTGASEPKLNEYGFYFDAPYSTTMPNGVRMSVVFKENGAMEAYANKVPYQFANANTCDYKTPNVIKINSVPCQISDEGLSVTFPGALVDVMLETSGSTDTKLECTFEEYHHVYLGETYYIKKMAADFEDFIFTQDKIKKIDVITTGEKNKDLVVPYSSYSDTHVLMLNGTSGIYISMDGNDLYWGSNGVIENTLFATRSTPLSPRIVAFNNNTETEIRGGNPEEGDLVIYDEYCYQYDSERLGYGVGVKDKTKTTYGEISDIVFNIPVTRISFNGCAALTTAPAIPSSVTDISYAFSGCTALTTAPAIPSSVTDIRSAFFGCSNENLTSITYEGTKAQWNEITKNSWNEGSHISTVYCQGSDETIDVSSTQ